MGAVDVTKENYEAILSSSVPVLIDLYAPWCGHCQQLLPTVEGLADEVADRYVIGKLNVDEFREKAVEFGIRSVPVMVLLKGGKEMARLAGNKSREEILEALEKIR